MSTRRTERRRDQPRLLGGAPLGRGQGGWGNRSGVVAASANLVNDEFTTDRSAGAVDGTPAEPGPGLRTVTDTLSKLTLSSGSASFATAGGGTRDPGIWYGGERREAGRFVYGAVVITTSGLELGWAQAAGATGVTFRMTGSSLRVRPQGTILVVGDHSSGVTCHLLVILREQGAFFLIKGGGFTYWTLVWVDQTSDDVTMFPTVHAFDNTSTATAAILRVPKARWLPAPLISDSFSDPGTSDGLGHPEMAGHGSGGADVSWTGTFAATDGVAASAITAGTDLLTDGGLENWSTATDLTSWTEAVSGSTTINRSTDSSVGTYAARFDVDGSNSLAKISQTIVNSNGDLLLVRLTAKSTVANRTIAVDGNSGANISSEIMLNTSYTRHAALLKTTKANTDFGIKRSSGASASITLDAVSVEVQTLASMIYTADAGDDNVFAQADITATAGELAGLVLACDSGATPANLILVLLDPGGNIRVTKLVGGVLTAISTTSVTYGAGKRLAAVKDASAIRVFYDGSAVWDGTISDAGIVSNTRHGIFSTGSGAGLTDFVVWSRGAGGEYDTAIDALIGV